MRILLTCFFPYSFSGVSDGGGVTHYIALLKLKLEQLGHTVDYFGFDANKGKLWIPRLNSFMDNSSLYPFIEGRLLPYFTNHYPEMSEYMRINEVSKYGFELAAAYCDLGSYDIIHAQDVISSRAIWRVKPPHVPLITTVHGIIPYEQEIRGWASQDEEPVLWNYFCTQERIGLASNNWLVVTSNWTKEVVIADFGALPESLSIVQNGMDIGRFLVRMNEMETVLKPPHLKVIACVARLAREKGIGYLIEALFRLKQERSDWECWVIGDGPDRYMLESAAFDYGLTPHIRFFGYRDDVPALLKQCDLLAVPSLQENCPYVIMEAHVAGVPVVASRAGGIPDMIIHETTGLLVERGNSFELYAGLKRMLEDDAFRSQIAMQAMNWGRSYWSIDERVKGLLSLYKSATGSEVATVSAVKATRKRAAVKRRSRLSRRLRSGVRKKARKGSKARSGRRLRRSSAARTVKGRQKSRRLRRKLARRSVPAAAHDQLYRDLFHPTGSQPIMEPDLWSYIRDRLPEGYTIPDPAIHATYG
jgi:glycosyltransferase involved in cell wall biosynthesis